MIDSNKETSSGPSPAEDAAGENPDGSRERHGKTIVLAFSFALAAASALCMWFLIPPFPAEYSDGVMQITRPDNPYWPPLYGFAARGVAFWLGDLSAGARLVSIVLGSLAIVPIALMAWRVGGMSAGILAALIYLALPEPTRWSLRVMTDAPFLFFFASSLWFCMPERKDSWSWEPRRLGLAIVFGALAAMTRYQGLLTLVPISWAFFRDWSKRGGPTWGWLGWVAWPPALYWIVTGVSTHMRQASLRTGADAGMSFGQTMLAWWAEAESYFYLFGYSITPPVFVAALAGLFWSNTVRHRAGAWLIVMFGLTFMAILGTQAVFQHFDFRYTLPWAAFIAVFAGIGLCRWTGGISIRNTWSLLVPILVIAPALALTFMSLRYQRESFADLKRGLAYAGEQASDDEQIFCNEFYNLDYPLVKAPFWAGRPVRMYTPAAPIEDGDWLVLSSVYSGGVAQLHDLINVIRLRHEITIMRKENAKIYPILTDVMALPGTHGNASGWFFRYTPQRFLTVVARFEETEESGP